MFIPVTATTSVFVLMFNLCYELYTVCTYVLKFVTCIPPIREMSVEEYEKLGLQVVTLFEEVE